jgi:hypothetical protein
MLIKYFEKFFYFGKFIFNIVLGNFYFPYLLTHSYSKAQCKLSFIFFSPQETSLPSDDLFTK